MVAITDEVHIADLVDFDRRQSDQRLGCNDDACPTLICTEARGKEVAREIFKPVDAANDGV